MLDLLDGGVGAGEEADEREHGQQHVLGEQPGEGGAAAVVPEGAELDEGGQHDAHHRQRQRAHQRDERAQVGDGQRQHDRDHHQHDAQRELAHQVLLRLQAKWSSPSPLR